MTLPFRFANATTATGKQLDDDFDALGALTPIPCAASGSNNITLVPATGTPDIIAYSNYQQFSFIVIGSNTGPATAKIGSLAQLPVYKSSSGGPIALTGGELVLNNSVVLLYDSSLNSGNGGFHLMGIGAVAFNGGTVAGPIVGTGSLATITYPIGIFPTLRGVTLASISALSVGGGPTISRILRSVASISFAALAPQQGTFTNVVFSGASLSDIIGLGLPANSTIGLIWKGFVQATGTVQLQAFNASSGTITPISGNYTIQVTGP